MRRASCLRLQEQGLRRPPAERVREKEVDDVLPKVRLLGLEAARRHPRCRQTWSTRRRSTTQGALAHPPARRRFVGRPRLVGISRATTRGARAIARRQHLLARAAERLLRHGCDEVREAKPERRASASTVHARTMSVYIDVQHEHVCETKRDVVNNICSACKRTLASRLVML